MGEKCKLCGKGEYKEINETVIAGTKYAYFKCDKCKHTVARRVE